MSIRTFIIDQLGGCDCRYLDQQRKELVIDQNKWDRGMKDRITHQRNMYESAKKLEQQLSDALAQLRAANRFIEQNDWKL